MDKMGPRGPHEYLGKKLAIPTRPLTMLGHGAFGEAGP